MNIMYQIKYTKDQGIGVFSMEKTIEAGTVIQHCPFTGIVLHNEQDFLAFTEERNMSTEDIVLLLQRGISENVGENGVFSLPTDVVNVINHSRNANIYYDEKTRSIVACKPINFMEQLLIDYIAAADVEWVEKLASKYNCETCYGFYRSYETTL